MLLIDNAVLPEFVTVTGCGLLVAPTGSPLKTTLGLPTLSAGSDEMLLTGAAMSA
jgi:hypothetical protein